jgi:MFS family permease
VHELAVLCGNVQVIAHHTALVTAHTTRLRRARWATRAQFAALGIVAGVWGVHVPSVKSAYALDERSLAAVLLATSVGSVIALFVAGRIVGRFGTARATVGAAAAFTVALALALHLPSVAVLLPVMVLFGAGESVYDVGINAEGTALETMSGRPIVSGLHGMFSAGAMLGSASAAAMLRAQLSASVQLTVVAATVLTIVVIAARWLLTERVPASHDAVHFAWPRGTLLLLGILVMSGMMAEGVMYNWSVLYVAQELATPQEQAAMAYVSFAGATALTRFVGDTIRARVSERTILFAGPTLSAISMALVIAIARPWAAYAGFALVGAGLATIVPILYNAATRVEGVSRAAAIASISSIGYVGFMIGPPIIGGIAHATTLSWAMGTLVVASLIVAVGAAKVPTAAAHSERRAHAHPDAAAPVHGG